VTEFSLDPELHPAQNPACLLAPASNGPFGRRHECLNEQRCTADIDSRGPGANPSSLSDSREPPMAAKKSAPAMDFIVESLRKNKNLSYAEVLEAAKRRNLKIYPIMYGRAKALLGLVPVSPRGQGRKAAASAGRSARGPGRPPMKRGPGRPPRSVGAGGSLDDVISALKEGDRERDRYRRALEQIRGILESIV
jgi:hypothetical protein